MVWRTPVSLQFGIDPVWVVMNQVTRAEEHMISALGAGISRSGLSMVGISQGGTEEDVEGLIETLHSVLLPETRDAPVPPLKRIDVIGSGVTARRLATVLAASERRSIRYHRSLGTMDPHDPLRERGTRPCDVAVLVGHFVLHPAMLSHWLRLDIPHLPVIFGDGAVTIGPFIEPGAGPCLYCLERNRTDADSSWPAIASQLWERDSGSETAMTSAEVVAIAARLVLSRLTDGPAEVAVALRLDAFTGLITSRVENPNPACGCRDVANAVHSGTGLPAVPAPGVHPLQPTTPTVSTALV
ncbi:MAG: hypothetical protein JWQ43_3239 [Glaciihabitans sp.]|nr:hypothetical protein [Glaciihabitans sp.]